MTTNEKPQKSQAQGYADRRLDLDFRYARSAFATDFESGNSAAKSGSSTMRFVPAANRSEYFPRTPEEKSYSDRKPSFSETAVAFFGLGNGYGQGIAECADCFLEGYSVSLAAFIIERGEPFKVFD